MTSGGGGGYERMQLDSILICIAYLTSELGSFITSIANMTSGKGGGGGEYERMLLDSILMVLLI
jgi:hypothetical protein